MAARLALGLTALFWAMMSFLLWRAEYGPRNAGADAVPAEMVWRRVLTAPDPSSLSIWQNDQRLGFGHWVTSIGEEMAELEEAPPEGVVGKVRNYQLKFDGNLAWPGEDLRLRFECMMKLATNQAWQEFSLRVSARPQVWEVRVLAADQELRFHTDDGGRKFSRVFHFRELQNPQALVADLAGPAGFGLLAAMGLPAITPVQGNEPPPAPVLHWEASSVHLSIGREPLRVFRLQTRLLDRFSVRIFVSRAGEILRVELPNGIVLKNDQINVRTTDSL